MLIADTYTSVLPEVAHRAAEKTAAHVKKARRLVPGSKPRAKRGSNRPTPPGPGRQRRGGKRKRPRSPALESLMPQQSRPQRC
ncbi:hypothetical protein GCM10010191_59780 [Actinomadura vinacea]|uniref:Uncharacterized protein n=1 Tax=Actinomadura vinacea TaxID=115336 RepID=A0ABN3JT32_9ACTN